MQVIFVRDAGSKPFAIHLSKGHFWGGLACVLAIAISSYFFGAWSIFQFLPDFFKLNVISQSKEKVEVFNDLGVLKGRIDALEGEVSSLTGTQPSKQSTARIGVSDSSSRIMLDGLMGRLDSIESSVGFARLARFGGEVTNGLRPSSMPVNGRMTSAFGWRVHPISGLHHQHTGVDYASPEGAQVVALADGVVVATYLSKVGLGKSVDIDHGGKYMSRYAHLDGIVVKEGDVVRAGGVIARVGSTGSSTGPHLHLEIVVSGRVVDPVQFIKKFGVFSET